MRSSDPVGAASTERSTYRAQSADTDPEIERRIFDAYRRMPPWEKARRVAELVQTVDTLALAGIAARHPGATDAERRLRLAALRLDRQTMIRAFGWDPASRGLDQQELDRRQLTVIVESPP